MEIPAQIKSVLQNEKLQFFAANAIFIALLMYAVKKDFEYIYAIPIILIGLAIAIRNFVHVWYLALFCLPLSLDLGNIIPGAGITFPTDALAVGLMLLFWAKMALEKKWRFPFLGHPIFWAIMLYFGWQWMATLWSTHPLISVKANTVLLWTIATFYCLGVLIFLRNRKQLMYFFWLIGLGFCVALGGIFMKYVAMGLNPFSLRFNPTPFFNDHTVFGGFTAMLFPFFFLFAFRGKMKKPMRWLTLAIMVAFGMGLFFSYSRGGWGAAVIALGAMAVFEFRHLIRKFWAPLTLIILIAGIWVGTELSGGNSRNQAVSRKGLTQHIASVTNFQTDYSNKERINRWYSAIEMWRERPWTGFGPGTYEVNYSGYQRTKYRTPVSVNHGEMGNAHNDFLLAASESGWIGGISVMLMLILPLFFAIRGYLKSKSRNVQLLYLGSFGGIFSYTIHSLVNNFLDHDNVSVAFFGMCAVITALDIYRKQAEHSPASMPKTMQESLPRPSTQTSETAD